MTETVVATGEQMLRALTTQATRAAAYCADRGIDEGVLLNARLFPDMLPLVRQMQIANDFASRPAARIAQIDTLSQPDTETSFAALIDRFAATAAWLTGIDPALLAGKTDMPVTFPAGPGRQITMPGGQYLSAFAFPNLFFHVATAHAILRANGVALGKGDFLALEP
ncbi:MAG: DUF1993 domain-containing protein [Sphingopyxis sp.]|nr:DUF1993 domain-containing protein [Sphingopyxis sp.]